MDRIDRALARIETQAALGRHRVPSLVDEDPLLAQKHEALKETVRTTLSELDTLIERLEK